jgi:hypothetical protein
MDSAMVVLSRPKLVNWIFTHYLNIAPPSFALDGTNPWAIERWSETAAPAPGAPGAAPALAA